MIVFSAPPSDFISAMKVALCYCEWDGKLLLLKRHPSKDYGGLWNLPGGKLEKGETPQEAAARELEEETGIKAVDLEAVETVYYRLPALDFTAHLFRASLPKEPKLRLSLSEHTKAKWMSIEEAAQSPLIAGSDELLERYKKKFTSSSFSRQ